MYLTVRRHYSLFQLTRRWLQDSNVTRKEAQNATPKLTHVTEEGLINMVDVSSKMVTRRTAAASCTVKVTPDIMQAIRTHTNAKAHDVLTVAKLAGIQASKDTSKLIPLCHQIALNKVDVNIALDETKHEVHIESHVVVTDKTGCEMEALVAASSAALTIYDMCKAMSKDMVIKDLKLTRKTGGKSGSYQR